MKRLFVLLPLLVGFDPTYSAPSCRDTSNHLYDEREFTCFSFSKAEDFQQYVPKDLNFPRLRFVLKECLLDHVPGAALAGIPALSLDFDNCKAKSFSLSAAAESNPFHGLEETVSRMGFMHNSSIPESWSLLKDLSRLKELAFYQMAGLDLTPDFNSLPQSVRRVLIFRSTIARVSERWLASMQNLEEVWIQESNLKFFSRSMLPRPAPKLWRLHLQGCFLSSLPRDFSDDLPVMRHLSLEDNQITTFEEESLAPLKAERTYVGLYGNPVHCDCKIKFLVGYSEHWRFPLCKTPDALAGVRINELTEHQLNCTASTTNSPFLTTSPAGVGGGLFDFFGNEE
ncbi:uncharacterized protein LOC8037172 [Ixodes scapularis]|uniref:uncharacterized protein LOC8037172 n=1 Tax=Ixodes scapularis TaxID=6945 RepID=UPI001A9DFE38|nr:uncharacterized protein LOC8037172 [Ixodes scapularis]